MTAPPTAVFDLDGTLADTAPDLVGALNRLLAVHDRPAVSVAEARFGAARGGRTLIRYGFEKADGAIAEERVEALYPDFLDHYRQGLALETRLYPGIAAALDALLDAGWRLGVCTNKPEGLARPLLEELGVLGHFDGVLIGADTLPVRKPDPLPYHETVRLAGGAVARSVMVGDTQTDLATARAARVPVALVDFGYEPGPVADLAPDLILSDFDDLPARFGALLAVPSG